MSQPAHLLARLQRPGSATHLATWRAVIALHLLGVITSDALVYLKQFNARPYWMAGTWFPQPVYDFTAEHLDALVVVGVISCTTLFLGLLSRVSAAVTLGVFLLTQNFWFRSTVFHDDWLFFTFPLLVLCFARSGDAWAVDAWLARERRGDVDRRQYRWPIEAGVFWFGFVYFVAGVAKLFPLDKGVVWITGVSTREFAVQFVHQAPLFELLGQAPFDYHQTLWPFTLASVGTVIVECGAVLVWFTDRYRWLVVAAVLGMHVSILFMGIPGFVQIALICSVVLIPSRLFPDGRG